MRRRRVNKRRDKRYFSKTARKVNVKNSRMTSRGGIRA